MKAKKSEQLNFSAPPALVDWLDDKAEETGIASRSAFIRSILIKKMKEDKEGY